MKAKRVKGTDPAKPLAENAARIVSVRLAELRSFTPAALERDGVAEQHDMRIAAKRLRYVLEVTGFCFGRPATTARRWAKDLQDLLGEIHDADVMLPRLREHRRAMREDDATAVRRSAGDAVDLDPELAGRAPHRTAYRGLEVLEVYLLARRDLLFDRFTRFWRETERQGVWTALEHAVDEELQAEERAGQEPEAQSLKASQVLAEAEQAREP